MTAEGAATAGGPLYMKALLESGLRGAEDQVHSRIIDCGEQADTVFGALDAGWRSVAFDGSKEMAEKLQSIVTNAKGNLIRGTPDTLDLDNVWNPLELSIQWIENHVGKVEDK